eukprot:7380450-Prymnesium_polylepis.1
MLPLPRAMLSSANLVPSPDFTPSEGLKRCRVLVVFFTKAVSEPVCFRPLAASPSFRIVKAPKPEWQLAAKCQPGCTTP